MQYGKRRSRRISCKRSDCEVICFTRNTKRTLFTIINSIERENQKKKSSDVEIELTSYQTREII